MATWCCRVGLIQSLVLCFADTDHTNCTSNPFTLGDRCITWDDDDYGTWFDARATCHDRGT